MSEFDMILKEKDNVISILKHENELLQRQITLLKEHLTSSKKREFGPKSEKVRNLFNFEDPDIFNETEIVSDETAPELNIAKVFESAKTNVKLKETLESFESEEIVYELTNDELNCDCGHTMHEVSKETVKELKYIPEQFKVIRHRQKVYACRGCEKNELNTTFKKAKMNPRPFPNSVLSSSLAAKIVYDKFKMGLPLYRQAAHYYDKGAEFTRKNLGNWLLRTSDTLLPIYEKMKSSLINERYLHADETSFQVLKEPGKKATSNSFMWVYLNNDDNKPNCIYQYTPTRQGDNPKTFLNGFKGYLTTDGYGGYNNITGVITTGCFFHARKYFVESYELKGETNMSVSKVFIEHINELFQIENQIKGLSSEKRTEIRTNESKKITDSIYEKLISYRDKVMPNSKLGKAINYSLNQWSHLIKFLEDERIEISNNRAERAIKPFVIGRKNWLFANSVKGAKSSEVLYSIVETAKLNKLDIYEYLVYVIDHFEDLKDESKVYDYLPFSDKLPEKLKVRT